MPLSNSERQARHYAKKRLESGIPANLTLRPPAPTKTVAPDGTITIKPVPKETMIAWRRAWLDHLTGTA